MANIIIDIASEFTGAKAFSKAESATSKLEKGIKSLGRNIGLSLGTAAVIGFGKASVKAAAADQKAQQQLALALKNVGLGRDAASSEAYIQSLQSEFGVVDDKLRPAYQRLAVATGSTSESQKLLNLSLNISASTGKDLESVTSALSKAYLGSNTALSKLGVGISKADLKAKSFDDIVNQLSTTFAGSATSAANTFQGSIDKLGVASNNVKETIGVGIIDALKLLGQDGNIDTATTKMQEFATATNETLVGMSSLLSKLKGNKLGGAILGTFGDVFSNLQPFASFRKEGRKVNASKNAGGQQGAPAELLALSKYSIVQAKIIKGAKTLTKLSAQQINDLKLKTALEKANLALGKGTNVFDLDAIQINAALINQAQLLGKATSAAQLLAIANDVARLNVKKDILALEDAIASGDAKAIEAATAKLNEDLKILGALQGQNTQMTAIKSILDGLKSKDLINQDNLDEALRKIREMLALLAQVKTPNIIPPTGTPPPGGNPTFIQTPHGISPTTPARTIEEINSAVEDIGGVVSVIADNGIEFTKLVDGAATLFQQLEDSVAKNLFIAQGILTQPFNAGSFRTAEGGSLFTSSGSGAYDRNFNINISTGIGDPNAIAEAVTQVIQDAVDRGTLRGGAY